VDDLAGCCRRQIILEIDDQLVAGIHVQGGRFETGVRDVAVARQALLIDHGLEHKRNFKQTILAAEVWRRRDYGTR